MQDACVVPEQGELPLGDNVVRLNTLPSRGVAETRQNFDEHVEEIKAQCENMVVYFIVAVNGDGETFTAGYRSNSCTVPRAMMPEVMRNAVLLRLAEA